MIALVIITSLVWPVGFFLTAFFVIYDLMFEKEDQENAETELELVYQCLDKAVEELEEMKQRQYQEKRDAHFKRMMEEGDKK